MTRVDALQRADQCEQLALATSDPERQTVLRHMRQLWLALASNCHELDREIDVEFDWLIANEFEVASTEALH
jgi:hypothetical protein